MCCLQLKTAGSLPGPTLKLAMYGRTGNFPVKLTGYPAQGGPGCESNAYQGACYQYSSTDSMEVTSSGMYSSSSLDLCSGHSGSGVMTADGNRYVVAVVTGEREKLTANQLNCCTACSTACSPTHSSIPAEKAKAVQPASLTWHQGHCPDHSAHN